MTQPTHIALAYAAAKLDIPGETGHRVWILSSQGGLDALSDQELLALQQQITAQLQLNFQGGRHDPIHIS